MTGTVKRDEFPRVACQDAGVVLLVWRQTRVATTHSKQERHLLAGWQSAIWEFSSLKIYI